MRCYSYNSKELLQQKKKKKKEKKKKKRKKNVTTVKKDITYLNQLGCLHGVVVNMKNCDIKVSSDFSCFNASTFQTYTLGIATKPHYPLSALG